MATEAKTPSRLRQAILTLASEMRSNGIMDARTYRKIMKRHAEKLTPAT